MRDQDSVDKTWALDSSSDKPASGKCLFFVLICCEKVASVLALCENI